MAIAARNTTTSTFSSISWRGFWRAASNLEAGSVYRAFESCNSIGNWILYLPVLVMLVLLLKGILLGISSFRFIALCHEKLHAQVTWYNFENFIMVLLSLLSIYFWMSRWFVSTLHWKPKEDLSMWKSIGFELCFQTNLFLDIIDNWLNTKQHDLSFCISLERSWREPPLQ